MPHSLVGVKSFMGSFVWTGGSAHAGNPQKADVILRMAGDLAAPFYALANLTSNEVP